MASEFRSDLLGHLEAAMASKATKMAVRVNMHMDPMAFQVVDFKSEVKFDIQGYWDCLKATMAISYPVRSKLDNRMIEAAYFKCEVKLSDNIIKIARESKGPLPSCSFSLSYLPLKGVS